MRGGYSVLALALAVESAAGQAVTVRGVAWDSLHGRPLAGALVAVGTRTTSADSLGRFTLTEVQPGTYRVTAQHDAIDRLGMSAIGAQARVSDGSDVVRVAIPSFSGLWKLACGQKPPSLDTGFVFGTVRSKRRFTPPVVSVSWVDLVASGTKVSQKLRTIEVDADSLGNFTLCGVPTSTGLTIRASADSAESGQFDIGPMDKERVLRRDLTLGLTLAGVIAAGRGATISGRVLADSGGGPIANAEITLLDLDAKTTSNDRGEYSFTGIVPGSHRIYVRKIGYAEMEIPFDVEEAERRERDIVLSRITVLDSVAVVGKHLARDEEMRVFDEHRKIGLGKFLTAEDLEKARGGKLISLIYQWPSLTVDTRRGLAFGKRGITSLRSGSCVIPIYLDGQKMTSDPPKPDDMTLNDIAPETLAGVEYFPGGASMPIEYNRLNNRCGVFLLHSRYKTGK
jgi:protocatechuate 3,4-dioxygenase beta subunit